MAEVFISYARQDFDFASSLSDVIERHGLTVWWDRSLVPGDDFRARILDELNISTNVIVLWSPNSVASAFVLDEANRALMQGKLVPFMIEACELPLGFGVLHYKVLSRIKIDAEVVLSAMNKAAAIPNGSKVDEGLANWRRIGASTAPSDYAEFVEKFPNHELSATARVRLAVALRTNAAQTRRITEMSQLPTSTRPDNLKKNTRHWMDDGSGSKWVRCEAILPNCGVGCGRPYEIRKGKRADGHRRANTE